MAIATLEIDGRDGLMIRVYCSQYALYQNSTLAVANLAGKPSDIWDVIGEIRSGFFGRLTIRKPGGPVDYAYLAHSGGKYTAQTKKLDKHTLQAAIVYSSHKIVPVMDNDALWRKLSSDEYSTPILREWMPALTNYLTQCGYIKKLRCHGGLNSCELSLSNGDLDEAVSHMLETRRLVIQ